MKDSRLWKAVGGYYLFVTEAKVTMCLFVAYYTFMYAFLAWVSSAPVDAISFPVMLQMFVLCILTGLSQRIILPGHNVTVPRAILWAVLSLAITVGFALGFGWFTAFPVWTQVVFWGVLVLGLFFMALHLHLTTSTETKQLNEGLRRFQRTAPDERKNA